jgi:hypothetical protein
MKESDEENEGFHEWFEWHVFCVFVLRESLWKVVGIHGIGREYLHCSGSSKGKMGSHEQIWV